MFEAEARAFVLDGAVRACAIYEADGDDGDVAHAGRFVSGVAEKQHRERHLPRTCVVDVGRLGNGRWAVVEFNATWGAGLNGCAADEVLDCIAAASANLRG